MKDATRSEVIEWCNRQGCDFIHSVFPAPNGWLWAQCDEGLCLTPIFTMTDQGEELYFAEVQNA